MFRDAFSACLHQQAILLSLRSSRAGANVWHLARAYEAGVDQDEIMERIDAGEVNR